MKPSAEVVLIALHQAGPAGMQTGELARLFDEGSTMTRLNRVRGITTVFERSGKVTRTGPEPSVIYHRNSVYRWHITEEGSRYLASGMRPGSAARNRAHAQEAETARQRELDRQAQLLASCQLILFHTCQRDAEIRHLRAEGVRLESIGNLYGITRERARQVAAGLKCGCSLPGHDYWVTPCTHGLVTGLSDSLRFDGRTFPRIRSGSAAPSGELRRTRNISRCRR